VRSINKIQYLVIIGGSVGALAIILALYSMSISKPAEERLTTIKRVEPLKLAFFTVSENMQTKQILSEHLSPGKDDSNYIVQSIRTLVYTTSWFDAFPNEKKIILVQSLDNMTLATNFAGQYNNTDPIIVYDIEHWSRTPLEERVTPVRSIMEGADIVHEAGFKYGVAPDADYLLDRYKEINWKKIDFVDMQLQRYSQDPETYAAYTEQVGSFIKSKNPQIELFVQISLGRADYQESIKLLQLVSDAVDGIFIVYIPESGLASNRYPSEQVAERTLDELLDEIDKIKTEQSRNLVK
jgi:Ni,Fe-hydrogenase maturation factor